MANFFMREDINKEKDRQANQQNQALKLGTPIGAKQSFQGIPPAPKLQQTPALQQPQTGQQLSGFDGFKNALASQNPNRQQIQTSINQTIADPTKGFQPIKQQAQDTFTKDIQSAQEQQRIADIKQFGPGTGQTEQAQKELRNQALMARQGFQRDLAAQKSAFGQQAKQTAIQQGIQLAGIESGERIAEKQLQTSVQEAAKQRDFTQGESAKDRALQELLADKKFTLEELKLAQNADQFDDRLAFDEWAVEQNLDERTAERVWQAKENAKLRAFDANQADLDRMHQIKLQNMSESLQLKIQNNDQKFAQSENNLNRELEKLLNNQRINADLKIQNLDQVFQERMQETGYLQTKELEQIRNDFAAEMQQAGFDQQTAERIATQQFSKMEAQRDRTHARDLQSLQNSFIASERVSSQDFQQLMANSEMRFEEKMEQLRNTFQLDIQENAQAFEDAQRRASEIYNYAIFNEGLDHETSMREASEAFQTELTKMGIDADAARQGELLFHQAVEAQKNRASTQTMAFAQLAQDNFQFKQEMMQSKNISDRELDLRQQQIEADILSQNKQYELLGIQKSQMEFALKDQQVQNALSMAAFGMEMTDGSEEAMKPFVDMVKATIGGVLGDEIDNPFKKSVEDIAMESSSRKEFFTKIRQEGYTVGEVAGFDLSKIGAEAPAKKQEGLKVKTDTKTGEVSPTLDGVDLKQAGEHWQKIISSPAYLDELLATPNSGVYVPTRPINEIKGDSSKDIQKWLGELGINTGYKVKDNGEVSFWDEKAKDHPKAPIVIVQGQPMKFKSARPFKPNFTMVDLTNMITGERVYKMARSL